MTPPQEGVGQTHDTLLDGRVRLVQPEQGYRVAIDPVFLAAAVEAPADCHVLDVGCGTGAALFCLLSRLPGARGVGLDRDEEAARCAEAGALLNQMSERVSICATGLKTVPDEMGQLFDVVMTNPPFYEAGTVPRHPNKSNAHALEDITLNAWIKSSLALLSRDGLFAIIHRAERLSDIIQSIKGCGATVIIPLWPKAGAPAHRVIVTTRKARKSPTVMHPGMVLHQSNGSYTDEANAILREGQAIQTLS